MCVILPVVYEFEALQLMHKTPKERLSDLIKYFDADQITQPEFVAYMLVELIREPTLSLDLIDRDVRREILSGLEHCAVNSDLEAFTAIGPIYFSQEQQKAIALRAVAERKALGFDKI